MRPLYSLLLSSTLLLNPARAHAARGLLLAADDPKQITQIELAQVMASDSTHWLSVRIKGRAHLVLVSAMSLEAQSSSDAWLRALDFSTRERIAAPPGPLQVCPERASFPLVDSGLPELPTIAAQQPTSAETELELQRALVDAGIQTELTSIAAFCADNAGPYQLTGFDAQEHGGATAALRWQEHQASNELPTMIVLNSASVPVSLIALAKEGVWPKAGSESDASEFPVSYFALGAKSDYVTARASWQRDNADRWLIEAENTPALFSETVSAGSGQIPAAMFRYFSTVTSTVSLREACLTQVTNARNWGLKGSAAFSCEGADDLARAMSELDFGDVRLTRLFGSTSANSAFLVQPGPQQNPYLQATDFDTKGGSTPSSTGPGGYMAPGMSMTPGSAVDTGQRSGSDTWDSESASETAPVSASGDDSGCSLWIDTSSDSCNGDSSPSGSDSSAGDSCARNSSSDDSSDSCSGDSSTDSNNPDSCSGDSSSNPSEHDSCSGDSDSSSKDSGCGSSDKSGYDGDTCTGNSASSTHQTLTKPRRARPHRVHLSLLTLLAAGLSLPLRRRLK